MFFKKKEKTEDFCLCPECYTAITNNGFLEVHNHFEQENIIVEILHKIAAEKNKSAKKIKYLLLDKPNAGISRRFWEILDETLPGHKYNYIGYCFCGCMDLKEQFPNIE